MTSRKAGGGEAVSTKSKKPENQEGSVLLNPAVTSSGKEWARLCLPDKYM